MHAHHLKGLLHCGSCGSRMLLDFATNPRGTTYAYFICSGRAAKKTTCTRRAVPVQVTERLVEDSYRDITISEDDYRHLAAEVDAAFDEQSAGRDQEFADLTANRARLEAESDKLLAAHFADAIDLPTLKRHQDRIRAGLADVERRLSEHDEHHAGARAFLHYSLRLLTDAHRAYAHSDDGNRRLANQAFYTRLEITDDEQLRPRLAEPFKTIITEAAGGKEAKREHSTSTDVACSRKALWVDLRREFENPCPHLKTLSLRRARGFYKQDRRPSHPAVVDSRGRMVRSLEMAQTLLDTAQVDELVTMYRNGESMREVAEHFRVHRATVAIHLRRRSVQVRRGKLTTEQVTEVGALYEQGFTLTEIGARFGVGQDTARRAVVEVGGTTRRPGRRAQATIASARGLEAPQP